MNRIRVVFSAYLLITLTAFGFLASQASAQATSNERETRRILQSLSAKVDDFRYRLSNDGNSANGNQASANLSRGMRDLQDNLRAFETKFNNRRENTDDVETLFAAARYANDAAIAKRLSGKNASDWASIRQSFEQLALSYNIAFSWSDNADYSSDEPPQRPIDNRFPDGNRRQPNNRSPQASGNYNSGLTGTYKLDESRSESADDIVSRAFGNGAATGNQADENDLRQKLETPDEIAVDVRGSQITIASNRAPQITFTADGREQTQQSASGGTIRVRSTLRGQKLTVSKMGGVGTDEDYTVTFAPADNGRGLRIMRRVTTAYLDETVFAESFYVKTDSVARLNGGDSSDAYSSSDSTDNANYPNANGANGNYPATNNGRSGDFIVSNGTILTGTLQNDVSTKFSQNNDRFRLNVIAPNEYRGAVIEGRLSGLSRSGKVSGRSQITFNFETIRLANGQSHDFAGFLQSITDHEGKLIKVDTEGTARGDSQTKETVKRGGIGAGIGAIIGAIAGGGQGAAIGAVIGGGAGAGSVVVQGSDDLELKAGSSITVQSSSPSR